MAAQMIRTGDLIIDGAVDESVGLSNFSQNLTIEIERIKVSWKRSRRSQKVERILLNDVEVWSGSERSGRRLELTSATLPVGSLNVPLQFEFNSNLEGKELDLTFYFTDGSRKRAKRGRVDHTTRPPRWRPDDDDEDDEDDHDNEWDHHGRRRRFDKHFENFWLHFFLNNAFNQDFLKVKVIIHPDRYGNYRADDIPVRPYIITAFHDELEMSIKEYMLVQPNQVSKKNFRFDALFPGYRPPNEEDDEEDQDDDEDDEDDEDEEDDEDDEEDQDDRDMAERLTASGNLVIDGNGDDDIRISNTGSSPVIVTDMKIRWRNDRSWERIQRITINGTDVWSGSQRSNRNIDIINATIPGNANNVPVVFEFSHNLGGKEYRRIEFNMQDNSKFRID